jgi:hypothetical protein
MPKLLSVLPPQHYLLVVIIHSIIIFLEQNKPVQFLLTASNTSAILLRGILAPERNAQDIIDDRRLLSISMVQIE